MQGPEMEGGDDQIAAINIIPLVDVVLVLLIIFMVTTVFTREAARKLELPKGSRQVQDSAKPMSISVSVDQDGNITVAGKATTLDKVNDAIIALRNQTQAKTLLVLRGDKKVIYGKLMPVLDEISRVEGVELTLALQPGDRP